MKFSIRPYAGLRVEQIGRTQVVAHASDGDFAVIASFSSVSAARELAGFLGAAADLVLRSEIEEENIRVERPSKGNG